MIKIIKEGKTVKFTKTCPKCECEFEYGVEDLHTDHTVALTTCPCKFTRYIICPWCGEHIFHDYTTESSPLFPNIIYTTTNGYEMPDCDKCINKPDPLHPVVGDSPCTWCRKNMPYCTSTETKEK